MTIGIRQKGQIALFCALRSARACIVIALMNFGVTEGQEPSTSSELSKTLSPLILPDIESAKLVLSNLEKLADSKNGAEKVAIQAMIKIIKNTYSAEFNVATKVIDQQKAETEAKTHEKHAREWLSPNAFGTINRAAAKDSSMKAEAVRKKATAELNDARENLIRQLRDADAMILIYHNKKDYNVVSILANTMLSINERSLPKDAYRPMLTREKIVSLNTFIRSRVDWLEAAKNAESSQQYEEAIRLYAKAHLEESKKRCANLLAVKLEELKLFGSALEYYEMAGNNEKAIEIRSNPFIPTDQFKVLRQDEILAKIAPSCVRISHENDHGTGFFFKKGGYILTNRHLVEKKNSLNVTLDDGSSFKAKIIATSPEYDLAIIKIDFNEHFIIGFRSQKTTLDLPVTLIGFPADTNTAAMNFGSITKIDQELKGHPVYQLDITANQGNSGGPVVDQTGQFVGMLTYGLSDVEIDKLNFAITAETVAKFINDNLK